jgi:site-specific recombinase XerD
MTDDQKRTFKAWRAAHRWHPNQLRHTAATYIQKLYDVEVAQAALGHSEVTTTQIYAQKMLKAAQDAMREFG